MSNKHIGSSFDDFLEEEGIREEVKAVAIKRVLAFELRKALKEGNITKVAMAKELETSRPQLDRILDPENTSITLNTMQRAAVLVGKKLKVELVDDD